MEANRFSAAGKTLSSILKKSSRLLSLGLRKRVKAAWETHKDPKFHIRGYSTYDEYKIHQKSKLDRSRKKPWLLKYDAKYRAELRNRLEKNNVLQPGMNVLCLAARLGTEVQSFLDLGCFAVGLDLNPGSENKYVLYGDFHDIQFSSISADVVFTNSLDHVLDMGKVLSEIHRILKPNGILIIEAVRGIDEGGHFGHYESFLWSKVDDLINILECKSFKIIEKIPFEYPWDGEHLRFRKCEQLSDSHAQTEGGAGEDSSG